MNRLQIAIFFSLLSVALFSGCKKDDKPAAKECRVEQFESTRLFYYNKLNQQVPYLFKKTFNADGRVNSIDAFVYAGGAGARIQTGLEYKNQMVYLQCKTSNDTIMVLWLNATGKVVKAEEKSGLLSADYTVLRSFEFTYNSDNKLQQYVAEDRLYPPIPRRFIMPVEYDANGNCTKCSNTSFTYDLTRTAKKQFYYDSEDLATSWLGVKLLQYLDYFPEITSPTNIRIFTKAGSEDSYVFARTALTDHQLDADGKLISYKAGTQTIPIFWNCGNVNLKRQ